MVIKFKKEDPVFGFLSNFAPHGFWANNLYWPSVEHFYQAMKTTREGLRKKFAELPHPAEAKKLGRRVPLRGDWENIKMDVMKWALERKFKNQTIKKALLATNGHELVENSPWDSFWGNGRDGKGKNMLGKLLMDLRDQISKGEK